MPQTELPFADPDASVLESLLAVHATWHIGEPDRSGTRVYHAWIRSPLDPKRMTRKQRQAEGGGFEAWRTDMKGDPRAWAAGIVRLLRRKRQAGDLAPTFNGIILELTGNRYTADVAGGNAPEEGLWLAVRRGLVLWSVDLDPGVVRFGVLPQGRAEREGEENRHAR